jgi:hypothetical protein
MIVNTIAAYIILHHLISTYYIILYYIYIWYAGSMFKFRVYSLSMEAIYVG